MTRGVAVVTGASAGVERAIALSLARRGIDVGLLARGEDRLKGAAEEEAAIGRRTLVLPVDVADAAAVDAAAPQVEDELALGYVAARFVRSAFILVGLRP